MQARCSRCAGKTRHAEPAAAGVAVLCDRCRKQAPDEPKQAAPGTPAGGLALEIARSPKSARGPRLWMTLAAALILTLAAGAYVRGKLQTQARSVEQVAVSVPNENPEPPPEVAPEEPTQAVSLNVDVQTDDQGGVLLVAAGTPSAVLDGYCRAAGPGGRYTAREVDSPAPGMVIGYLEDLYAPGSPLAIRIRRDRASNRWVAGDGVQVITPHRPSY